MLEVVEGSSCNSEREPEAAACPRTDFFNLTRPELAAFLKEKFDVPAFRATQLFEWVYRRGVRDFALMTNIGKELREAMAAEFFFPEAAIRDRQISQDGTRKYLFEVEKGDCVEAVMIKQPARMTLCVSSQVGCGMGCAFCRTATMGFKRHLATSEILRQVLGVIKDAENFGDHFDNIVFMGMGEPLHNLHGISGAVRILTDDLGLKLAPRKITVSTVGLVPAIKKFGEAELNVNLAVSLNATTDEVRSRIMPINKAYKLADLLGALREFPVKKRKKITIEYVMLAGVNDNDDDLERLPKLLKGIEAMVNLIPYNENAGLGFKSPAREKISRWVDRLNSRGVHTTVRWSKGSDIKAACGQLATASTRRAAKASPASLSVAE